MTSHAWCHYMQATPEIKAALCFENSKVRKRFLKQTMALKALLDGHGCECVFLGASKDVSSWQPIILSIKKNEHECWVFLREGEKEYTERDMIFLMCSLTTKHDYTPAANQIAGMIRTLIRWSVLKKDEISDEELSAAQTKGSIVCELCCETQQFLDRFKQCFLCKRHDDELVFPAYRGFYCCKACQVHDWKRHSTSVHKIFKK